MDAQNTNRNESAKMAFPIDLNETPMPSPREAFDDAVLGSASISVCSVCRKGVPVGRLPARATEEQRQQFKCFRCLLKKDAGVSTSGGGGVDMGRFDINASPPLETEEVDDVAVPAGRDGNGGGQLQGTMSSFFHHITRRQLNPVLEDIRHNLPKTSPIATKSATPSEFTAESPNMLYLQTLREYISQRAGSLGEGWHVEFEFCNIRYKTSAVYIAPDGSRFKSMEDVASRLGLPSQFCCLETDNRSNEYAYIPSILRTHPANKDSVFLAAQNCSQRNKILRDCNSHGFLSSSGIAGSETNYNKSMKVPGFPGNSSQQDGFPDGFPVQFQDFCLISAGSVDQRPSYHNADQIWPVGYRCSWHDRITGSLFVCDVADGGDCGPIFKIHRYPCTMQSIPVGSTILSKKRPVSCKGDDMARKDYLATFQVVDDDSISSITLLNEDSPPCIDNCVSVSKREDEVYNSQEDNSSNLFLPQGTGNSIRDVVRLNDTTGEFQVEGRSTSFVWKMVSKALLYGCHEIYKQKGVVKFFCGHDAYGLNENPDSTDSLSRYCCSDVLISIPRLVQNENEFNMACEKLLVWLNQDRFGLDADFVQEIIEQLPGVTGCPEYKKLNDRKNNSGLQTVGSGFLQAERNGNTASETSKRSLLKLSDTEGILKRGPCPPGKALNSKLPLYLMGDALQVWELVWRFSEVLGLGKPFSFQEFESELVSPWSESYTLDSRHGNLDIGEAALSSGAKVSEPGGDCIGRCKGLLLGKMLGSLLELLVGELLSKASAYVCPNLDTGEIKSRRGRKKDLDCLAALKKAKLDMLPVNGLTWHEISRRYILAVMCMEGNLDSAEIASRESGKVFHCLRGDGGILCGALTGIAALEGDAVVLADATKEIFGSLRSKNEITVSERESDTTGAQTVEVNDSVIPEWAQVLEPVRKLPTNVGARIRRCINEALEKNPPEWAKQMLEHSISKEVYKGNASGPTKRAVIQVLANVSSENPQQKVEKKEKIKVKTNLADLITKQCRIVLHRTASSDEDRVFCNLLARIVLNPNDNDDEGVLGYPAMVSRPLDFRTIDLRLAAGAYGGSHETFFDDVQEVWRNIRIAYGDRPDLIDVVENLSKKFEELYEKEVMTFVHKIAENVNASDSSADAIKERDDLLVQACNSSLPRAPWDEGICKVCGMDKDDDNVLLCDKCDSEYHRYCLSPPLLKIPEGNWKRKHQGEFTSKFLEELARLAKLMEIKEYWEFTIEERIFFMKFLFDEALNSATIREHMDQSSSRAADLQQKLRSLTYELKVLKAKEDMLGLSTEKVNSGGRGDMKSDASSSLLLTENSSRIPSEKGSHLSSFSAFTPLEERPSLNEQPNQPPLLSTIPAPASSAQESRGNPDKLSSQDNILKAATVKSDISSMRDSIASIELELLKVSLRKDFLGRDSNGRVYWGFYCPGARPWIMACGDSAFKERCPEEFIGVPDSHKWMYYESDDEIEKLVGWLRENNPREKELKESILQLQNNKLKDSQYTENHILSKVEENRSERKASSANILATKAMASLENKFGPLLGTKATGVSQNLLSGLSPDCRMYRCECLELLWPSNNHCASCHQSFPTTEELGQHLKENCKPAAPVPKRSQTTEDVSKRKKLKIVSSQEKRPGDMGILQTSTSKKQNDGSSFADRYYADCPFNFEEIMTRFVVPGSIKDAVNSIGLIGNGGIPSFSSSGSLYLSEMPTDLRSKQHHSSNEGSAAMYTKDNKESSRLSGCAETFLGEKGSGVERLKSISMSGREQVSSMKNKNSLLGLSKSSLIRESSSRPLVGRASEILRFLKINLLDMDAALPQDALRTSRSNEGRRYAWRAFVKSAKSIYEMVQAMIILEDTIRSEYLRNDWWYWSSPSTAAKTTTLSSLALRIYSLDAAISYEKSLQNGSIEMPEPSSALEDEAPLSKLLKNLPSPSSPSLQKTPEPDSAENPRTRSRTSKRRKDLSS
ncbi:hypothetical protein ACP275_12G118700 [Erythranthe tilingii]